MKYAIALDVGGTSIKSAVVSFAGKIENETRTPMDCAKTPQGVVEILARVILAQRARGREAAGVGVGFPGPLDSKKGIVFYTPNLPFKKPFPLWRALRARVRIPVAIQNDANLALLGEVWKGAARGARVAVMLTLGSGVGGGILVDGKIFDGAHGQGAELGHFPLHNPLQLPLSFPPKADPPRAERGRDRAVPPLRLRGGAGELRNCGAGHPGCFEAYVNVSAMVEEGKQLFGARRIKEPLDLFHLAKSGDRRARRYFADYGRLLAVPTAYLLNVFNPEVVIFGGAISGTWRFFAPALNQNVRKWVFQAIVRNVRLKRATLSNRAGIFGAAKLAFDTLV